MKHLVTLIAAGLMAVLLAGCGEQAPKQPEVKTQNETVTTPAEEHAAPAAAEEHAAPAAEPAVAEPAAPAPAAEPAAQE